MNGNNNNNNIDMNSFRHKIKMECRAYKYKLKKMFGHSFINYVYGGLRMKRRNLISIMVTGLFAVSTTASAVHLTTISIAPSEVTVVAGDVANFSGTVGTNIDCGPAVSSYGSTLTSAGGPVGSFLTLDPTGSPVNGPLSYSYDLTVDVPGDAAVGSYPVTVNAAFAASGCISGSKNASATLHVLAGMCPAGGDWFLQKALGPDDPFDKNGDGWICSKPIPGMGEGNSANRSGAVDEGHLDGHNHKDNNN